MRRTRTRRSHPARPFVITVLLLSIIAIASFARQQFSPSSHGLQEPVSSLQRRADEAHHVDSDDGMICRDVHHVHDKCAFIHFHCQDEEAGLISYLNLYYCRLGHVKPIAFVIIVLWAAVLFTTIGVAASEFFCINLSTISNILGLSESLAGVTFLAFGNGSPDVFSTFAAMKSHSGSLAVGELFGAAGFITAVVAGSMAMIKDFPVPKRSFLRDAGFFIIAVGFSMTFLSNGSLDLWECVVMVGFYVFYVITVVVWHWRMSRLRKRRELEALARGHFVEPGDELEFEEEYHDEDDTQHSTPRYSRQVSMEDFENLERADFPALDTGDDEVERDRLMGELSSNMRIRRRTRGQSSVFNPIRPSLVGALEFQAAMSSLRKAQNIKTPPINLRSYSDGLAFTQAQQRDAASITSEPEGSSRPRLRATTSESVQRSADGRTDVSTGARARAVSANSADLLGRAPDRGRHQNAQGSRFLLPEDKPLTSSPERHDLTVPARRTRSRSPLVSISPPTSPPINVADTTLNHSRADTSDLLAPPDPNQSPPQTVAGTSHVETASHPSRPQLTVTPPEPHQASPRPSPRDSPLTPRSAPGLSGHKFPQLPLLSLPPPSASIDQEEWQQEDFIPWKFWPYKVLPPPQEFSRTLFPSLCGWKDKRIWERLLSLTTVPSFFCLTITLPVVEPDEEDEANVPTQRNDIAETPDERARKASTPTENDSLVAPSSATSQFPGFRDSTATVAVEAERRHDHNLQNGGVSPTVSGIPQAKDHPQAVVSSGKEWNRWLVIIHCFTAPFLIVLTVWGSFDETSMRTLLRPALYSLLSSMVALLLILITTTPNRPPKWHFMLCFLGFAVAITWISSIANEVVGVLKTIGVIFNMSDAILGLTIFAVGNSLGDLVADVQVARLGFPYMAFSACFGGPMLNILLGIGLSGLYMTVYHSDKWRHHHPDREGRFKPYKIEISLTLMISAIALLVTLVGLVVAVPLNGWRMDRKIGIGLMILWVVTTTVNVIVELVGFSGQLR
ncbi:MAG: hypothetical protein M1831_004795 [Alyxoria varia]|nr:MAG: hypothetical protein M1831_004795 [Alyxoria varia]